MNKPKDVLPEGISIEDQGSTRIITYEWYSHFYIPLFIFFLFWDGFLFYYYIRAMLAHDPDLGQSILFGLPHILVGLFMTYYMIAIVVNITTIELGNHELKLTHTPLPWRGNQTVNMFELQMVTCERGRGSRRSPSADIVLYFNNGERRKLLSSMQNWETARFIRDQIVEFRNRSLHLDVSPSLPSVSEDAHIWDNQITDHSPRGRFGTTLIAFLLIVMVGTMFLAFRSFQSLTTTTTSKIPSPGSYDRIEIWDLRADDTVRFTTFDARLASTSKQSNWFSLPSVWKDTDITNASPIAGTVLEHYVSDDTYRNQTYRFHSYLIESDQRVFGCSVTFAVLPHLHITSESSRLISIGFDPSDAITARNSTVIVVALPDGASDVAVTDMRPYKTLTQNARKLYYYDLKPITAHVSIHIAYTLTGISTTDINLDAVMQNSQP